MAAFRGSYRIFSQVSKHLNHGSSMSILRRNHLPQWLNQTRFISEAKNLDFVGVMPPIVTPFKSDGSMDIAAIEHNVRVWQEIPFRGYVVLGSNGEYVFMSSDEKVQLLKMIRDLVPPSTDKLIIGGSGCESTSDTVEMCQKLADVGADAVLVVTPSYYGGRMTPAALANHYEIVADKSPVPTLVYSVPACTGLDVSAELAIKLSEHPNIVGMKDSGGNVSKIGLIAHRTRNNNFSVIAGSAGFFLPSLTVGAVGCIPGLGNVLGADICEVLRLFQAGKMEEATALQQRLIAPNTAVTAKFGVPGMKTAMSWFGLKGGYLRQPLIPLTESETQALRKDFSTEGYIDE